MSHGVCPWWMGYWPAGRWRQLIQNPDRVPRPFVAPGITVLEIGPGMGFFTRTLADLVGLRGKVVCVNVQERMLQGLERLMKKAGVAERTLLASATPPLSAWQISRAGCTSRSSWPLSILSLSARPRISGNHSALLICA